MMDLYFASYEGSDAGIFNADLNKKDKALIIYHGETLVGFTTLKSYDASWGIRKIRVVYSGDTVVRKDHWGQQELARAWLEEIGHIKAARMDRPLYWFLLVKGHRTYKFLTAFARTFYPNQARDRNDLKPLADILANDMFGDNYCPDTGVVRFNGSRGHLAPGIAWPTAAELTRSDTRFFLSANPGYLNGEELVCVCELELFNMKPLAQRIVSRSMAGCTGEANLLCA